MRVEGVLAARKGRIGWVEKKAGKERYFLNETGWFSRSVKEVTKAEYSQRHEVPSYKEKVLRVALGILAISSRVYEFVKPISVGHQEAFGGLVDIQQNSPILSLFSLSLLPIGVMSQDVEMSSEFQVNTFETSNQDDPAVASLMDGGFVVVWVSEEQDGNLSGVFGKRYDSNGSSNGGEFQVNDFTTNNQWLPSVSGLVDGGYIVTWESVSQNSGLQGVYAKKYGVDGISIDGEFQVYTNTSVAQKTPSVAALRDGGFVATWVSQDGGVDGIFMRKYNISGAV